VAGQFRSNLDPTGHHGKGSAYLRIPFVVSDPAAIEFLTLRLKYDDGFVAWLNGQVVARANAPMVIAWNSSATATRSDAAASAFEEFNLASARGLLRAGTNVLAIQGLNVNAGDSDFLILPE